MPFDQAPKNNGLPVDWPNLQKTARIIDKYCPNLDSAKHFIFFWTDLTQ